MKYENAYRALESRGYLPVGESLWTAADGEYGLWRRSDGGRRLLVVFGQASDFEGLRQAEGGDMWLECPLTHETLSALQQRFP